MQQGLSKSAAAPSGAGVPRLDNLQILRFVAAMLVVWFHWTNSSSQVWEEIPVARFGTFGVDLFFVLSGFIMAYTTRGGDADPVTFFKRRVARIVPIYWLLTVAIFGVAMVAPALLGATEARLDHLLMSMFFIPFEKSNGLVQPMIFLGWTLNYEMFFYLVFALACLASGRGPLVIVTAVFCALAALGLQLGPEAPVIAGFFTDLIILEFVAGMWLWVLYSRVSYRSAWFGAACILGGLALLFVLRGLVDVTTTHRVVYAFVPAIVVVWGVLMLPVTELTGRVWPVFVLLGDASYALYLVHPYVQRVVLKAFDQIGFLPATLLMLAVTLGVSVLLFRLIEKPSNRALLRVLSPRRAPGRA